MASEGSHQKYWYNTVRITKYQVPPEVISAGGVLSALYFVTVGLFDVPRSGRLSLFLPEHSPTSAVPVKVPGTWYQVPVPGSKNTRELKRTGTRSSYGALLTLHVR